MALVIEGRVYHSEIAKKLFFSPSNSYFTVTEDEIPLIVNDCSFALLYAVDYFRVEACNKCVSSLFLRPKRLLSVGSNNSAILKLDENQKPRFIIDVFVEVNLIPRVESEEQFGVFDVLAVSF
jgi:hypothetical protein